MDDQYATDYPKFPAQSGLYAPPTQNMIAQRTAAARAVSIAPSYSYGPDQFGDEEQAASYPAPAAALAPSRANPYQTTGEGGGNMAQRGYANTAQNNAAKQQAQNTYGDTDASFGFRNRLAAGGAAGEQLTMQYGPGAGGALVTATADRNGRFNQFSGNSPGAGMPSLQARYQDAVSRAAALRAQPASLLTRRQAVQAQREANDIQTLIAQQAQLGIQNRQQSLAEQTAAPRIQRDNTFNQALGQPGGYERVQAASAALAGAPNFLTTQGIMGTTVSPVSALSRDAATYYPNFTAPNTTVAPLRPLLSPLPRDLQP